MSVERDFSNDDEAFTRIFPIHRACRDGDVGALLSLYQHHADLTTEDSCYGWTPIHWAAHCGQLECVIRLVQMGCDVNMISSRFNQTPTHTAALGGHPRCVLWLSQAGADVNRQDLVGEAPIHKAARAASMECIQVLLIAGAKLHLRNTSGQTAADLARTQGSNDCLRLMANLQQHLLQLGELQNNENGSVHEPGLFCRKRLQSALENGQMKKARREVLLQHSELDDSMESSCGNSATITDSAHALLSDGDESIKRIPGCDEISTRLSWQHRGLPHSQRNSADMCGSLHLTESANDFVSHWSELGSLLGTDCGDFLRYGHYHGFGDTAEELSDRGHIGQKSFQNVHGAMHLCQDA